MDLLPPILQLETASGLSGAIGQVNVVKAVEVEPSTEPNMPSTNLENLVKFHTRRRSFVTPIRAEVGERIEIFETRCTRNTFLCAIVFAGIWIDSINMTHAYCFDDFNSTYNRFDNAVDASG